MSARWPTRERVAEAATEAARLGVPVDIAVAALTGWGCTCGRAATAVRVWPSGAHEGLCDEHAAPVLP